MENNNPEEKFQAVVGPQKEEIYGAETARFYHAVDDVALYPAVVEKVRAETANNLNLPRVDESNRQDELREAQEAYKKAVEKLALQYHLTIERAYEAAGVCEDIIKSEKPTH